MDGKHGSKSRLNATDGLLLFTLTSWIFIEAQEARAESKAGCLGTVFK
jgi:hypothetical protein